MRKTGKVIKCSNCGKPKYKSGWELKKSKRYFCSITCANTVPDHWPEEMRKYFRKLYTGKKASPESCARMKIAAQKRAPYTKWLRGDKHPRWRGGISFLPWGPESTVKLKKQIKERDNYTCKLCQTQILGKDRSLHVHHIDYNKFNNDPSNLVSLCRTCHGITNFTRDKWTEHFTKNIVKDIVQTI